VAILGGGYSGLWTAYYLLLHEPVLRVAVVDKEIAGFGASGRNGGWCSPNFPVTAGALEKRFGAEAGACAAAGHARLGGRGRSRLYRRKDRCAVP
jgi:glycine/D-amino acid oxidase-like deaminating enzyme